MSTVSPPHDAESDPRIKAVFDDIRATRKVDTLNNLWHYLAATPGLLEEVWADVKSVMATESALDSKTKEMLYIAVSVANSCSYCVHSHTAAARAKGMTNDEYEDLLRVVTLAARTNHLVTGLQVPVDAMFDKDQPL
jgi:AhpD family alkylhydroperoxidase